MIASLEAARASTDEIRRSCGLPMADWSDPLKASGEVLGYLVAQRDRIADLEAQNIALRDQTLKHAEFIQELGSERLALSEALVKAPHDAGCFIDHDCFVCSNEKLWSDGQRPHPNVCNCWKSALPDALARGKQIQEKLALLDLLKGCAIYTDMGVNNDQVEVWKDGDLIASGNDLDEALSRLAEGKAMAARWGDGPC